MKKAFSCIIILLFAFSASAMTLTESVGIAVKNNPSVIATQKQVNAADAKLAQAVGSFLPTVKLDGNYGQAYTQPSEVQIAVTSSTGATAQTFRFGTDATNTSKGWKASLSQPLFVGALFPGLAIAQRNAAAAREGLRKNVQGTTFNATQAYYDVLKTQKGVEAMEQAREMAQSHRDKIEAMASSGASTQADLMRAEVQLANSELALTRAKNAFEIAKNSFNNVLGRKPNEQVKLDLEISNPKEVVSPDYDRLIVIAMDNRPDWKQYQLGRQMAEDSIHLAQTDYLPAVMLTGSSGYNEIDYPTYVSSAHSWTVVGAASWTLFNGFNTTNRVREASARLEEQIANEDQLSNNIALEVRDAYLDLNSAKESIISSKKALDSAKESLRVSNLVYNSGAGTNLEVINAQISLTQARLNYYQSLYELETSRAMINKVVGKELL